MSTLPLALRAAGPDDAPFLFDLFASTRQDEFAFLDSAVRAPLMQMQFRAQEIGYTTRFPGAEHNVILYNSQRAGRIWIARSGDEIRVVDISLMPEYRRMGIGSAVYRRVIEEAAASGSTVTASVVKSNAASLGFHRSLGFTITSEDDVYYAVAWSSVVP